MKSLHSKSLEQVCVLHNQLLNEALLFLNFFGDSSTLGCIVMNAQEFILQHEARKRKRRNVYVCDLNAAAGSGHMRWSAWWPLKHGPLTISWCAASTSRRCSKAEDVSVGRAKAT
jgi:hypothetical protein